MDFNSLHQQKHPLLIGNVWDALSAKVCEKLEFGAIGTSSAALAHMLGYEDRGKIPFADVEFVVKRIASATSLPLSVDIESGYGDDISTILDNIQKLCDLGIAGINIEDSLVEEKRQLTDAGDFAKIIYAIKNHLIKNNIGLFINARTDTFLLGLPNALDETIRRASIYERAGADGLFVPCIVNNNDIAHVTAATGLPLNVMCMPQLPDFKTLESLGVKRISMGNFLHNWMYAQLETKISQIVTQQSFVSIF